MMSYRRPIWIASFVSLAALLFVFAACGSEDEQVPACDSDDEQEDPACDSDDDKEEPACELQFDDGEPFDTLSEYCFFEGAIAEQKPNEGVVLYDVSSELYSDNSSKNRFIVLPDGEQIGFDATEPWSWPDGTILVKTFYYPVDARSPEAGNQILETRLLIKRDGEWESEIYIWDDDQEEANRFNIGERVAVSYIDDDGDDVEIDYRIPERAQCADCHAQDGDTVPLGPRTNQLLAPLEGDQSQPPQLVDFAQRDMFDGELPDLEELDAMPDPRDEEVDLEKRTRSYLDANCAHCHSPGGRASSSNLHLEYHETNQNRLGICKTPVAAGPAAGGRSYDIVPGHPDESLMVYRMESTDPEVKMPELPITTVDEFGVDLVRQWIEAMEPEGCP